MDRHWMFLSRTESSQTYLTFQTNEWATSLLHVLQPYHVAWLHYYGIGGTVEAVD